jgi:endogenous inhibitor of DNA gyrase (YacG/DUF329 family)
MKCPICKRKVVKGGPFDPFCSERCRQQDLANWATESYRIPAPLEAEQELEEEDRE